MAVVGTVEIEVRAKVDNFEKQVKTQVQKASGQVEKASGSVNQFGGVLGKADAALKKFGLTTKDVSVLLGAGLAGGAAFALREIGRFVQASIEAASALEEQRSAAEAILGSNSEITRSFAETAAAIGLSERAALQATNTFGGFFQNIGLGAEASANLAVGFTALASDIGSLMDVEPEVAIERIISGLRGESDALERLNITVTEGITLQRAIKEGFGKTADEISNGEKVLTRALLIMEGGNKAYGNFADTAEGLANTQRQLNAEWENAQARLGQGLQPAAIATTKALTELVKSYSALVATPPGETGFSRLARIFITFNPLVPVPVKAFLGLKSAQSDAADTSDELAAALEELLDEENRAAVAAQKASDETDKLADAQRRLDRAIGDRLRNNARARERYRRAIEDAELREDAAERALAEAREDRAERLFDAQARLTDERLQSFRSVRDARERLADFEIDSERKVIAAEERILAIRRAQARAILSALLDVQSAQIAGDAEAENRARLALSQAEQDEDLADAEKDLALEKKDRDKERGRLERELAETIADTTADIKEAKLDLARVEDDTKERIEDAQRRIRDAHRDSARAIVDAQNAVTDAMREGDEAVSDAQRAVDKLKESVDEATAAFKKLNDELGFTALHAEGGIISITGAVDEMGSAAERAVTSLQRVKKQAETLRDIFSAPIDADWKEGTFGGELGDLEDIFGGALGKQHGGPITSGRPYIVGEAGPELVVPGASGTVVSNAQLLSALKEMLGGGGASSPAGASVQIITGNTDPRVLANEIAWRMAREVKA